MFTGIIESLGTITKIETEGTNKHFTIESSISAELKIDQSVAHNGACLTVIALDKNTHTVTAIEETFARTSLGHWKEGDVVNLERAMAANARLDGHFVQGHVDTTGTCIAIENAGGSWYFTFEYEVKPDWLLIDKGSVTINGTSLTVCEPKGNTFSVAIIPYTFEQTVFGKLNIGDTINLEFDMIGKYITKYMQLYK